MKAVRIYTTPWCGYCHRAKRILEEHDIPFEEIDVDGDFDKRAWLRQTTGQRTVPQIFFGDEPIGGCTDLMGLVYKGTLEQKVGRTG